MPKREHLTLPLVAYRSKPLTVAWRSSLLPAKCFTSTVIFGWHHLTSISRDDLNAAHAVASFEPSLASPTPISRECVFGDDTFKFPLSTCFKQGITITIKLIAELNAALVIRPEQTLQAGTTLNECLLAKVLPIEMQQIERIEDDTVGLPPHRSA
jgi:hypothetical protein